MCSWNSEDQMISLAGRVVLTCFAIETLMRPYSHPLVNMLLAGRLQEHKDSFLK